MKKIFYILLATLIMISLCACGNQAIGPGNYSFKHVHIGDGAAGHCATVINWHEDETGIELRTKEFGSMYCSEGTYILFEDGTRCPFC